MRWRIFGIVFTLTLISLVAFSLIFKDTDKPQLPVPPSIKLPTATITKDDIIAKQILFKTTELTHILKNDTNWVQSFVSQELESYRLNKLIFNGDEFGYTESAGFDDKSLDAQNGLYIFTTYRSWRGPSVPHTDNHFRPYEDMIFVLSSFDCESVSTFLTVANKIAAEKTKKNCAFVIDKNPFSKHLIKNSVVVDILPSSITVWSQLKFQFRQKLSQEALSNAYVLTNKSDISDPYGRKLNLNCVSHNVDGDVRCHLGNLALLIFKLYE